MRIKITADSTCDLSSELVARYGVSIIPLYVNLDNKPLRDQIDVTPNDVFDYFDRTGKLCFTSACNIGEYVDVFTELRREYDAVIHISISSDLSSTHQNAVLAAQEVDNVYVFDSRNLSSGHGYLVIRACELAAEGSTAEQILDELKNTVEKMDTSFILDQLEYLKKGGRCSALTVLGANMLKLKPCIEVKDGKMGVGKKYRGAFKKCLGEYVRDRIADRDDLDLSRVFVTHSGLPEDQLQFAVEQVKQLQNFEEVCVTRAGCTVSSHCGPNTIGVLFIRK